MAERQRVRIVSDGTCFNTRVYVDDVALATVSKVVWELDAKGGPATAIVTICEVEADVVGWAGDTSMATPLDPIRADTS